MALVPRTAFQPISSILANALLAVVLDREIGVGIETKRPIPDMYMGGSFMSPDPLSKDSPNGPPKKRFWFFGRRGAVEGDRDRVKN
jgi:hypothetical protein